MIYNYFRAMRGLVVNGLFKGLHQSPVVDGISFEMKPGERLGIAGETGAGKSSLLKMIGGLLQPDAGSIFFEEQRVRGPQEQLLPGHPGVAYVSQHFELLPNYTVKDFLSLRNQLSPERVERLYSLCAIDHLLHRTTHQLSGGERQRIAIANALGTDPRLLLLDEPFSNLDPFNKQLMQTLLGVLEHELGFSTLIVSHDGADLLSWASRLLLLQKGRIVQQGTPPALYRFPLNGYCAGLLGAYTEADATLQQKLATPSVPCPRFLRPEQILLLPRTQEIQGCTGTVKQCFFKGSHLLVEVSVGATSLLAASPFGSFEAGQELQVSLAL